LLKAWQREQGSLQIGGGASSDGDQGADDYGYEDDP
jgi:hypothetical protein